MTEVRLTLEEISTAGKTKVVTTEHKAAFRALNTRWLEADFAVEPVDEALFRDPDGAIVQTGGSLFFIWRGPTVVGTCALKNQGDGVYELIKMAVDPRFQGVGIGQLLMDAVLDQYCQLPGKMLFLETHPVLQPAIRLYARNGFVDQGGRRAGSAYARGEVYMIWSPTE